MRRRYVFPKAISLQMIAAMTSQSVPAFHYTCRVTSFELLSPIVQPTTTLGLHDQTLNMLEFETS
jgi:hypothetical protein